MLKAKSGPVNKSPKLQLDFRKEKDDLDMEVGSFYGECFWDNVIINGAFAGGVSWTNINGRLNRRYVVMDYNY